MLRKAGLLTQRRHHDIAGMQSIPRAADDETNSYYYPSIPCRASKMASWATKYETAKDPARPSAATKY